MSRYTIPVEAEEAYDAAAAPGPGAVAKSRTVVLRSAPRFGKLAAMADPTRIDTGVRVVDMVRRPDGSYPTTWAPIDARTYPAGTAPEWTMDDDDRARYAARLANLQAHGQAWSLGTPRTAEEASVMLGQVEPPGVAAERALARSDSRVVVTRVEGGRLVSADISRLDWRPTRDEDGTLRGGWLDDEVPALCTLRERCEASGARVVIRCEGDGRASVVDRYGEEYQRRVLLEDSESGQLGTEVEQVLWSPKNTAPDADPSGGARQEPRDHAGPYGVARDWCVVLLNAGMDSVPVDPTTAAATWQAMRAAAPERVYPEPSE